MNERPLVIIMQGGATRAAFGAGVLYELASNGVVPRLIASASAGTPTAAYFVASQHEEMRDAYTNGIGDLISITNLILGKPLYDINHLLNETMRKRYPLSVEKIAASPTELFIPLFNYRDGRTELRSNRDPDFLEHAWSLLHISLVVHADHILRGTQFEQYVDGALDPFALFREVPLPENARVLVIWNESDFGLHWMKRLGYQIFMYFQAHGAPKELMHLLEKREDMLRNGLELYDEFCARRDPVVIIPDRRSAFEGFDVLRGGRAHISRLFEHGREKGRAALASGL